MRTLTLLGMSLLCLTVPRPASAQLTSRDQAAIRTLERHLPMRPGPAGPAARKSLAELMTEHRVPAVSIAYVQDGRLRWARAYGVSSSRSGRRVTPGTIFQAASMSKAVAAAGALQLVDRSRLRLDGDASARLQGWRLPATDAAQPFTLRQLLSHTAGLSVEGYRGYLRRQPLPTLAQSLAGQAPAVTPAVTRIGAPGAQFSYSGGGYSVVQLLIAEREATSFATLMRRLVLRPLAMTRSGFEQPLPGWAARQSAHGHDRSGKVLAGGGNVYPEQAAAGLWTTPSDYARFVLALQNSWNGRTGALLRPATARGMMTPVADNYGLGVRVIDRGGHRVIMHAGTNEGFVSQFIAHLDGRAPGVVIMTNSDNGGALIGPILAALEQAYGWSGERPAKPGRAAGEGRS